MNTQSVLSTDERELVRTTAIKVMTELENQILTTRDVMDLLEGESPVLASLMKRKQASSAVGSILFTMARNHNNKRYRNIRRAGAGRYVYSTKGLASQSTTEKTEHKVISRSKSKALRFKFLADRGGSIIIEGTDGHLYEARRLKSD